MVYVDTRFASCTLRAICKELAFPAPHFIQLLHERGHQLVVHAHQLFDRVAWELVTGAATSQRDEHEMEQILPPTNRSIPYSMLFRIAFLSL